jgi:hypothetical protein
MVVLTMIEQSLVIVRPTIVDVFRHSTLDEELAKRLALATEDASLKLKTCLSCELRDLGEQDLKYAAVLVVNPLECLRTCGNQSAFLSALASADKRIVASTEATESPWYAKQFSLPIRFDAAFDIGFVSRSDKHQFTDVPYRFVFNGPTRDEKRTIARLSPSRERPIRWAMVARPTTDRLELAAQLSEDFDPGGFLFMPGKPIQSGSDRPTWKSGLAQREKLSPARLATVLSQTSYYVWTSAHGFAHYESMRFVAALRAGAVPCKIANGGSSQEFSQIPGIFPSFQDFCAAAQEEGTPSMYRLAKNFYLSKDLLATHLEEALKIV